MSGNPWKQVDPLFRGDEANGPSVPDPASKTGIVAHVLYLGGRGRGTPFTSTTESEDFAAYFASPAGRVWQTSAATATREGAAHLSRKQLLQLLKGYGKGKAKWTQAWEVAQAAQYVEQWSEHLLDWSKVSTKEIARAITQSFSKRSR